MGIGFLIFTSCSPGIITHSVKSKKVDLKQYKSYAWVIPQNPDAEDKKDDKLYGETIIKFASIELEKKGFVLDTTNPDAVFIFDTRMEEQVEYTQSPQVSMSMGFGGPYYYGGYTAPISGGKITAHTFYNGMLFINMYDAITQQLLWKGWAEERLTYDRDIYQDIQTAIKNMFIRLPVKHK